MRRRVFPLLLPLLLGFAEHLARGAAPTPLALHPQNPRYFLFRGQPKVIVTSGEHYGALVDRHFDFVRYFKELEKASRYDDTVIHTAVQENDIGIIKSVSHMMPYEPIICLSDYFEIAN